LFVYGSVGSLVLPKVDGSYTAKGGRTKVAFKQSLIYTRQNTSTVPATGEEFWKLFWGLLKRTAEETGSEGTPVEVISVLSKKALPDEVEETLWFNLFPVAELPDSIHVADCQFREPREIYEHIIQKFGRERQVPPFL